MKTLLLLHTAASHIPTFDQLLADRPADISVRHIVAEPLLADARSNGLSPALAEQVLVTVRAAGADALLCTCSTIGGLAETAGAALGLPALRVDRPMAARAVATGHKILVVAALASTLAPTLALLREEAARANTAVQLRELLVPDAWPRFEDGDLPGYYAAIAAAIRAALADAEVVVLAQASMAGALPQLADLSVPVLSSPALGAAAALSLFS